MLGSEEMSSWSSCLGVADTRVQPFGEQSSACKLAAEQKRLGRQGLGCVGVLPAGSPSCRIGPGDRTLSVQGRLYKRGLHQQCVNCVLPH